MSILEDLWLAHDPLAFCMSTNTFNNPSFEAILEGASPCSLSIRRVSNPSIDGEQEQNEEQVVGQPDKKGKLETIRKELSQVLNSFCDNIGFSLKSKLFLLELSLKRKLGRFKRFLQARGGLHRVSVFHDSSSSSSSSSSSNNNNDVHGPINHLNGATNYQADDWLCWLGQEPHSKESFSLQKERILSRLEQVKRVSKLRRLEEQEEDGPAVLFNMKQNGARWSSTARLWSAASCNSSDQVSWLDNEQTEPEPANKVLRGPRTLKKRKPTRSSKWSHSRRASKYNYHTGEPAEPVPTGAEPFRKLCIICYTNQPNIVTLPCKHHEICSDCFVELIYGAVKHSRFPLKCVLCRQKVERIRCSRRWLLSVIEKSRLLA